MLHWMEHVKSGSNDLETNILTRVTKNSEMQKFQIYSIKIKLKHSRICQLCWMLVSDKRYWATFRHMRDTTLTTARKGPLHCIVTNNEIWTSDNCKWSKARTMLGEPKCNIHRYEGLAVYLAGSVWVIYYELLKQSKIVTSDCYWLQLKRLNLALEEKQMEWDDKFILLYDVRLHITQPVKKYLE